MNRLLISVLCLALQVVAEESSPSSDSLRTLFLTQMRADAGGADPQEFAAILLSFPTEGESMEPNRLNELLRLLASLKNTSTSKPLNALCDEIAAEFKTQAANTHQRFDSELRDAMEKGFAAISVQDFDAPLATLARLETQTDLASGGRREVLAHITRMLSSFQDELIQAAAPPSKIYRNRDGTPFTQRVQWMKAPPSSMADIMPFGEYKEKVAAAIQRFTPPNDGILSKEEFEKQSLAIIQGIKNLEDMDAAFVQLDALEKAQRRFGGSIESMNETSLFKDLRQDYHALQMGAAAYLHLNSTANISHPDLGMAHLQGLIIRRALPRVLQPPAGLVQREDEDAASFLQRVLKSARERSDWPLFGRGLDTALCLYLSDVAEERDREAFLRFLAAMDEEQARALPQAVNDYSIALRLNSPLLPAETIKASLQKIQKESPDDYAAGQKLVEPLLSLYEKVILAYHPSIAKTGSTSLRTPLVLSDEKTIR